MLTTRFDKPVSVFVGLGFPRDVETVWQAYELLNDWPHRGPAHAAALDACRAGLNGDVDADTVRGVFEAFARKAGILAPDALELAAADYAREWLSAS